MYHEVQNEFVPQQAPYRITWLCNNLSLYFGNYLSSSNPIPINEELVVRIYINNMKK